MIGLCNLVASAAMIATMNSAPVRSVAGQDAFFLQHGGFNLTEDVLTRDICAKLEYRYSETLPSGEPSPFPLEERVSHYIDDGRGAMAHCVAGADQYGIKNAAKECDLGL